MALENVEDSFKNRLSFSFSKQGDWAMDHDFYIKEHNFLSRMIVKYLAH